MQGVCGKVNTIWDATQTHAEEGRKKEENKTEKSEVHRKVNETMAMKNSGKIRKDTCYIEWEQAVEVYR